MKTFQNLTLIGTSHIALESVNDVTRVVTAQKPKIIAVELDQTRLHALLQKRKRRLHLTDLPKIGVKGYLFALIGAYLQKKLGQMVGLEPGSEMLQAVRLAKTTKAQLALIDQPIEITLQRFSRAFSWKEKFRFFMDLLSGLFRPQHQIKKYQLQAFDLAKVPPEKLIQSLMAGLKKRYPSLYLVLVEERNHVLAKNLARLIQKYPEEKILAVIGAGHESELLRLVKIELSLAKQ